MTVDSCSLCSCVWYCLVVSCIWFPCLCIMSCVFCFVFFHALMCPLSSPVYFPVFFPLAPSVYCIVPFMFSHVLLPFVTTPGLLPPLSPHLFLVCSSVSVYLVCVFPSFLVQSLYLSASVCVHAPIHVPVPCSPTVCVFGFEFCISDLNFDFSMYFVLPVSCNFVLLFLLLLCLAFFCYFSCWQLLFL